MPFSVESKNQMLDNILGTGGTGSIYGSLHNADPGVNYVTALANELSGGVPSYARKPLVFNAAGSGQKVLASSSQWDVPAGAHVAYVGFWKVSGSGNASQFIGSTPLSASEDFGGQGTFTLTAETFIIA